MYNSPSKVTTEVLNKLTSLKDIEDVINEKFKGRINSKETRDLIKQTLYSLLAGYLVDKVYPEQLEKIISDIMSITTFPPEEK